MNDEFLYAARRDPPPQFASRLKCNLKQQAARRTARHSVMRAVIAILLIGSSAVAATLLFWTNRQPVRDGIEISQVQRGEHAESAAARRTDVPHGREIAPQSGDPVAGAAPEPSRVDHRADQIESRPVAADPQMRAAGGPVAGPAANLGGGSRAQGARTPVGIVASSLAHPLAKVIVDQFNNSGPAPAAQLDIRDAANGFRAFCQSTDLQQPTVVIASRRIEGAEFDACRRNGVTSILESKIGYQAVVLTHAPSGAPIKVTAREVYLALAKWIPDPADPRKLLANPHAMWSDIDPKLYFRTIEIFGPPRDSTIRGLFAELVLEPECDRYASLKALKDADRRKYTEICHTLRTDGAYREGEQTATLISQRLWAEPNALVILDYGFYQAHRAELAGTVLGDVEPTLSAFAAGTYQAARPVYVYVNKVRLDRTPGVSQFLFACCSEQAIGPSGYLPRHGLIPLDEQDRKKQRERQWIPMQLASST